MSNTLQAENEIDAVEADKVEQYIDDKFIGERIRRLRLKRSSGTCRTGYTNGPFGELSVAARNWTSDPDDPKPGETCPGVPEGPLLFLSARENNNLPLDQED